MPVACVAKGPFAILIEADSPIRTLDDLLVRANGTAANVTLGNEVPRTLGGMIARLFSSRVKVDTNFVFHASVG